MYTNTSKRPKTLEERKVEALEKIAKNTERIADKLDDIEIYEGNILINNLGN